VEGAAFTKEGLVRAKVEFIEAVRRDPNFRMLVTQRTRFAWALTAAILIIYLGYIALVAFAPKWLGTPMGGATTIGIPIGLLVIASAFALTAVYVYRANSEFDGLIRRIIEKIN
jgi:uncharacterized membrane protein (DUF485 family)